MDGWDYNNPKTGGFQKVPFVDQETGPGLLLVEGGTFTMGRAEQDVMHDWDNRAQRVTVSSFYMDQTEVTNFNEKYVDYYLRHPAYRDYPVVGVSWLQANDYCKWRTDRVNEYILIREGIFKFNTDQRNENTYNTDAYYAGQYDEESLVKNIENLDPDGVDSKGRLGRRQIRMEDGILLPRYRLPTEAEWEFAAAGLIGNLEEGSENISDRRLYPWNGHWVRQDEAQFTGQIRANFVRGRGDYMGVAGNLNDGADVTAPVESYWPNDYGLYHMAGNVSEWVLDVYRPLTSEDYDEFRPFRGNVFKTKLLNNEGSIEQRNQQVQYDIHGMKEYLNEYERIRFQRISANGHDPSSKEFATLNDTVIPRGLAANIESRNQVKQGHAPDPFYVSHGKTKDSIELKLLADINAVVDQALIYQNEKHYIEASALIQDRLFDEIFTDSFREGPDGEEYAFESISILRDGFREFIIDTPGKLKYRNVTEEENIGRLNYRRDDYIDYLDGDIESSIYYANDERKNDINQATRDPNLIMYQSMHEEYDLDGGQVKPGDRTSWPTTLISDKSHVYKGGSWKDRAYWLAPSQRRFLDEDQSTDAIGFRCAMDRVGSPTGFNYGRKKKKKK